MLTTESELVGRTRRHSPARLSVQLHNSLADGKPPQVGIDDVLAPAPPDADAEADPAPPLDPLPPLEPDPPDEP